MNKPCLITLIFVLLFGWAINASGQQVAIKTNLLSWGTTTPNISIETSLNLKTTLELSAGYNPWIFGKTENNKKLQHWIIRPEIRFWIYEKYDGHFLGIHAFYGRFNAGGVKLPLGIFSGLRQSRFEGHGGGVGFSYGYQWYLGTHWNLEATFGFGYSYLDYDRYECPKCGEFLGRGHKHYFGPTKTGVSIVYLIKSKKK